MIKILVLSLFITFACTVSPPVYDFAYHMTFDQTYVVNGTKNLVNGQIFYDPAKNRQRVDRTNGRYNFFCGTVSPNVSTPCQQYTINNKRYIVYPQKSQCCFCCDSDHGCGILRPDWLKDAEYLGYEMIIDTQYQKFRKDGIAPNYYWCSQDANRTPRRLDQNNSTHITDYNVHSFRKQNFADSIFTLPPYCNTATNCPLQSACGRFRSVKKQ